MDIMKLKRERSKISKIKFSKLPLVYMDEIIETYVNEDLLTNGFPDTKKINPLIYCMDNNYCKIGDFSANAFKIGKNSTLGTVVDKY